MGLVAAGAAARGGCAGDRGLPGDSCLPEGRAVVRAAAWLSPPVPPSSSSSSSCPAWSPARRPGLWSCQYKDRSFDEQVWVLSFLPQVSDPATPAQLLNWFPLPVVPSSCRCDPAGPYSKQMVEKLPHLAAGWSPCCPQLRGWPGRAVPTVHHRAPAAPGGRTVSPALGAPQHQGGRAPARATPWQCGGCAGGCPGPGLQRGDVEAAGDGEHELYCWQRQEGDRPVWGCGHPVSRNNGTFLPRSCCSPVTQHLEGRMCFGEP